MKEKPSQGPTEPMLHDVRTHKRLHVVNREFHDGLQFINSFPRSVTVFGSARTKESEPHYKAAQELGKRIAEDLGYAIVTGGGPGIMEAAHRGAREGNGTALGLTIRLPHEQITNPYVSHEMPFHYFFTRKVAMTYSAEVYVYFPGGFGTLDEFFEMLTLKQTGKISPVPIVCYGSDFWKPLQSVIETTLRDTYQTISPEDLDLYTITDNIDDIIDIIKQAPVRIGENFRENVDDYTQ